MLASVRSEANRLYPVPREMIPFSKKRGSRRRYPRGQTDRTTAADPEATARFKRRVRYGTGSVGRIGCQRENNQTRTSRRGKLALGKRSEVGPQTGSRSQTGCRAEEVGCPYTRTQRGRFGQAGLQQRRTALLSDQRAAACGRAGQVLQLRLTVQSDGEHAEHRSRPGGAVAQAFRPAPDPQAGIRRVCRRKRDRDPFRLDPTGLRERRRRPGRRAASHFGQSGR